LAEQLDQPEYLAPLIVSQWAFHNVRSEHKLALSLGEQLEQIGEARNDNAAQLLGRLMQGITRFYTGKFFTARALLDRCVDLADPANRMIARISVDAYPLMLVFLALTLACLGYIDQARCQSAWLGSDSEKRWRKR
jgi:hypothetical protein